MCAMDSYKALAWVLVAAQLAGCLAQESDPSAKEAAKFNPKQFLTAEWWLTHPAELAALGLVVVFMLNAIYGRAVNRKRIASWCAAYTSDQALYSRQFAVHGDLSADAKLQWKDSMVSAT